MPQRFGRSQKGPLICIKGTSTRPPTEAALDLYRRHANLTADTEKCPAPIWNHLHSKAGWHYVSVPLVGVMVPQLSQSGSTALVAFKNFDPMNRSHTTICNPATAGSLHSPSVFSALDRSEAGPAGWPAG